MKTSAGPAESADDVASCLAALRRVHAHYRAAVADDPATWEPGLLGADGDDLFVDYLCAGDDDVAYTATLDSGEKEWVAIGPQSLTVLREFGSKLISFAWSSKRVLGFYIKLGPDDYASFDRQRLAVSRTGLKSKSRSPLRVHRQLGEWCQRFLDSGDGPIDSPAPATPAPATPAPATPAPATPAPATHVWIVVLCTYVGRRPGSDRSNVEHVYTVEGAALARDDAVALGRQVWHNFSFGQAGAVWAVRYPLGALTDGLFGATQDDCPGLETVQILPGNMASSEPPSEPPSE